MQAMLSEINTCSRRQEGSLLNKATQRKESLSVKWGPTEMLIRDCKRLHLLNQLPLIKRVRHNIPQRILDERQTRNGKEVPNLLQMILIQATHEPFNTQIISLWSWSISWKSNLWQYKNESSLHLNWKTVHISWKPPQNDCYHRAILKDTQVCSL